MMDVQKIKHIGVCATLVTLVIAGAILTVMGHDGSQLFSIAGFGLAAYLIST